MLDRSAVYCILIKPSRNHLIIPDVLYKYRDVDLTCKKSISKIEQFFLENKLYYSSPSEFNDPFDCFVHYDFSEMGAEEFKNYCQFNGNHIEDSSINLQKEFESFSVKENQKYFIKMIQSDVNRIGVLSLCIKKNGPLMWSHYASGHQGFCLGFDTSSLEPYAIDYLNKYPKLQFFKSNNSDFAKKSLISKSRIWEYEDEWRCFKEKVGSYKIKSNALKEVIFGSQICSKKKGFIKNLIIQREYQPTCYQAKLNKIAYTIDIIPL